MIRATFYYPHVIDYRRGQKFLMTTLPAGTVTIIVSKLMIDPPIDVLACAVSSMYHKDCIKWMPKLQL